MRINLFYCFAIACFVFVTATCGLLFRHNMALRAELSEAAAQIRLQETVRQASDSSLVSVREKENELREQRKKLGEKLEAAACASGSAYIDALMELLGDDGKKRCN